MVTESAVIGWRPWRQTPRSCHEIAILWGLAFGLLPPASCLLPPASCLLPPASCFQLSAFSEATHPSSLSSLLFPKGSRRRFLGFAHLTSADPSALRHRPRVGGRIRSRPKADITAWLSLNNEQNQPLNSPHDDRFSDHGNSALSQRHRPQLSVLPSKES
jgi:hypothetical protein